MNARPSRTDGVELSRRDNKIVLRFEPPHSATLGLPARTKETQRRVRRVLKQARVVILTEDGDAIDAQFADERDAAVAAAEIGRRLTAYGDEKLSPEAVEQVLRISSRERVRWTKDGRLPRSGTTQFNKGKQRFQIYQYPVSGIGELQENPEAIAEWRAQDVSVGRKRLLRAAVVSA